MQCGGQLSSLAVEIVDRLLFVRLSLLTSINFLDVR